MGLVEALDIRYWAALQAAQSAKIRPGGSITFTAGIFLSLRRPMIVRLTGGCSGSVLAKPAKNWTFIAGGAGALDGITRGLAVDLAPIRVNTIAPGVVSVVSSVS